MALLKAFSTSHAASPGHRPTRKPCGVAARPLQLNLHGLAHQAVKPDRDVERQFNIACRMP